MRRQPPPGSKNKKSLTKLTQYFARMEVRQLRDYIGQLEETRSKDPVREFLEGQLAGLQIYANNKTGAAVRAMMRVPRARKRAKPSPKYQSRKDKKLKWTGRGNAAELDARGDEGYQADQRRFLTK